MPSDAIGLDIGGANLKAATVLDRAVTRPFELWKRPEALADELAALAAEFPQGLPVGVTMTGELCDCFPTKRDGVRHILAAVEQVFPAARTRVWSTTGEFLTLNESHNHPFLVAAANWHALGTFVGRFAPHGAALLIDTGSTTTDVIPLSNGSEVSGCHTDNERMRRGELVYTGARRTPICAILGSRVAAELFATTLDVYLRLGMIPEEPANLSTADGRPASKKDAHARLSRMLCGDPETVSEDATENLARSVFHEQKAMIVRAMSVVAMRLDVPPRIIIVSGSGEFLAQAAAMDFLQAAGVRKAETTGIVSLANQLGPERSDAACAFAVAVFAAESKS
jgi:(4-(4-[2-(gamma-L-glutamylamino)ethyl]phenoxymethyl)furan-2-yl)methanamine synthase